MRNLARKIEVPPTFQEAGVVLDAKVDSFTVEIDSGRYVARRALSCLLEPVPGDLVLVSGVHRGEVYVLAVLKRGGSQGTTLAIDGDLTLKIPNGSFNVAASEGINLLSTKKVAVVA